MALIPTRQSKRTTDGLLLSTLPNSAAGGGDTFVNNGKETFVVKNGGGGSVTVTFVTPATPGGFALGDQAATVAAGETRILGPFEPAFFNDTGVAGGSVSVTYSGVTSVTVDVVAMTAVA